MLSICNYVKAEVMISSAQLDSSKASVGSVVFNTESKFKCLLYWIQIKLPEFFSVVDGSV